ncbi:MAG TPA: NlpC/P60 family protein, partial [Acidimicrobiales bacterium]|nr:NlpC/P60 family protein [Acidimicrobiales bacterium]
AARAEAAAFARAEAAARAKQQAEATALAVERAKQTAQLRTAAAAQVPAATTTTVPGVYTPSPASQVPGASPAASVALQAALSRIGDPYVWGASGPNAFDCSGLVMWAYAQAGVSLPHFSGAQYAMTIHIPMSDLEPGDLVFPADPGQHVAMYVGNGMIVQAPYTGADVQEVPLSSFFVLASRVG